MRQERIATSVLEAGLASIERGCSPTFQRGRRILGMGWDGSYSLEMLTAATRALGR